VPRIAEGTAPRAVRPRRRRVPAGRVYASGSQVLLTLGHVGGTNLYLLPIKQTGLVSEQRLE
jgi:hypothetical protein